MVPRVGDCPLGMVGGNAVLGRLLMNPGCGNPWWRREPPRIGALGALLRFEGPGSPIWEVEAVWCCTILLGPT